METLKIKKLDRNVVADYISKIVEKQYNSKVLSVNYLGGGSFGLAYKVMQDCEPSALVAKAYKVENMHKKEAYALKTLGEHTQIKYPAVYFLNDATDEFPIDCMCMEFIEGKDAFTNFALLFKPKNQKIAFAESVVNSMLEIHSFTNPKFGDIENPSYDNWLDYYKPFATEILETSKKLRDGGKLDGYIVETMEKAYAKFDIIFAEEVKQGSLIHGDLNVMNIMVKKPFTVAAIIDPLESKFADREYDLFQLNNLTGKKFGLYKLYKEKYPVSKNCDIKCAFYGLWNEVYCFIKAETLFKIIMNPLVKNMKKLLERL
ncbi:MAG: fructosamine kinase family protein [Clostridia bacterium]|nr:fructosamine kinase family protein [Clostridia bacterium]